MKWLFDIKYAYRMLLKNPGFTSLTVSVMAAGLGLCVFMLVFIATIITRPLPFEQGEQMYVIELAYDGIHYNGGSIMHPDYLAIKEQSSSYSDIGAYYSATANLSNGDRAQRYSSVITEANMFSFTNTSPIMGRVFTEQDAMSGAEPVTVIGYEIWQNYFNGDQSIVGQSAKINGVDTLIVGVMPQGYLFPMAAQLWQPLTEDTTRVKRSEAAHMSIYVKKKPAVSLEQANQEVKDIMSKIAQQYPETNSKSSAYVATFQIWMMGDGTEMIIGLILSAVSFVLILACVNVGNLLFARANERAKETAIRVALGAPRSRLIMQMMWESVFICGLGGLFGLFLAAWSLELLTVILPNMLPISVPYWWNFSLNNELILQSIVLIIFTAFVTGILPAWKMSSSNFNAVLRDGTRGAMGKKAGRINRFLVIVEVALSCILLSLSGVLYVVLQEVNNSDFGANIENKLTARVGLPNVNYQEDNKRIQYFQRLITKLTTIPGVNTAGAVSGLPGSGNGYRAFQPEGYEVTENQYPHTGQGVTFVGSMQAMEMNLLEGRYFDSRDRVDSLPVAVITESMATKYWQTGSALGKRFKYVDGEDQPWLTVVGVINHVIPGQPFSNMKYRTTAYLPFTQQTRRFMSIFIDTQGNPEQYHEALISAVASIDPEVPAYSISTLTERLKRSTGGMNFIRDLFAVFAVCALLLASSGIYGVLANSTSRRTQEIGIRRAIGASDEKVLSMLMKQGWIQLLIGLVVGLPIGYLASQGVVQMLGPDTNNYTIVFAIIPVIISLVVTLATFVPAKRAISMEPCSALRYE
jgi:putative ABC transport system permease protein